MNKVFSKDGTEIAYDIQGQGAKVIFVDGALGYRSFGPMPELAKLISTDFTVITYDRRGRGDSGDNKPYALEHEIEDIEALIDEVGGLANLYGVSSGGCLVLEAAIKLGDKVKKLAANSRSDAVALFMAFVGAPADQIEGMRKAPMWSMFEAVAPTLAYDAAAMGGADRSIPVERVSHITASTLVMHGGAGMPFMKQTAQTLSKVIRTAEFRTIEGQTHAAASEAIAPVLVEFFKK